MSEPDALRVGILGCGRMGRPMGGHWLKAGFSLTAYDPIPAATEELARAGARIAGSPRELAQTTDVAVVMVGFAAEVETCLRGADGFFAGAGPGATVVIGSTVQPELVQALAAEADGRGIKLIDAPMARGERGAVEANLLWFVGGAAEDLERCRPVLAACGGDIHHLGKAGSGQVAKAINNLLLWVALVGDHEAFELADAYGVEREALRECLLQSSGANWALSKWADMQNIPWAQKDMTIALEMSDHSRLSLPLCGLVREQVKALQRKAGY